MFWITKLCILRLRRAAVESMIESRWTCIEIKMEARFETNHRFRDEDIFPMAEGITEDKKRL